MDCWTKQQIITWLLLTESMLMVLGSDVNTESEIVHCPSADSVASGVMHYTGTTVGSTATVFCKRDYVMVGGSGVMTCKENGQWSNLNGTCQERCIQKLVIKNGLLSFDDNVPGSKARAICETGYELVGSGECTCKDGKWTAPAGYCQRPSPNKDLTKSGVTFPVFIGGILGGVAFGILLLGIVLIVLECIGKSVHFTGKREQPQNKIERTTSKPEHVYMDKPAEALQRGGTEESMVNGFEASISDQANESYTSMDGKPAEDTEPPLNTYSEFPSGPSAFSKFVDTSGGLGGVYDTTKNDSQYFSSLSSLDRQDSWQDPSGLEKQTDCGESLTGSYELSERSQPNNYSTTRETVSIRKKASAKRILSQNSGEMEAIDEQVHYDYAIP